MPSAHNRTFFPATCEATELLGKYIKLERKERRMSEDEEAGLSVVDRNLLWRNQVLNPFAFEGLENSPLKELAYRYGQV